MTAYLLKRPSTGAYRTPRGWSFDRREAQEWPTMKDAELAATEHEQIWGEQLAIDLDLSRAPLEVRDV